MYGKKRRFVVTWFDDFPRLEYSTKVDKAYCLPCHLFKEDVGNQCGRGTFSSKGFCDWSKKSAFKDHQGDIDSFHYKEVQKCDNLMKQTRCIHEALNKQNKEENIANQFRLSGYVRSARFCLENSLPYRGHDES